MKFIRDHSVLLSLASLLVYVFTIHQSVSNRHAHWYEDEVIIHSHPPGNRCAEPAGDHEHSKEELYFYQLVKSDWYTHSVSVKFVAKGLPEAQQYCEKSAVLTGESKYEASKYRGPPSLLFFRNHHLKQNNRIQSFANHHI